MKKILYGVSSRCEFEWSHIVYGPFSDQAEAEKWLSCEEYDSRTREIMGKTSAIKLAGRKAVKNAVSCGEEKI